MGNFNTCLILRHPVSKTVWTKLGLNRLFVVRCNVANPWDWPTIAQRQKMSYLLDSATPPGLSHFQGLLHNPQSVMILKIYWQKLFTLTGEVKICQNKYCHVKSYWHSRLCKIQLKLNQLGQRQLNLNRILALTQYENSTWNAWRSVAKHVTLLTVLILLVHLFIQVTTSSRDWELAATLPRFVE